MAAAFSPGSCLHSELTQVVQSAWISTGSGHHA